MVFIFTFCSILSPHIARSSYQVILAAMNPEKIQQLIQQGMPAATVEVTGGEGKFVAQVISDEFTGLSLIKRHKLVYACVKSEITSGELHALTIVAKTPAEMPAA